MDPEAVRQFALRDWAAVAASKRTFWAEQFKVHGFHPAWEASNALLADMRATRPGYPSPSDRADDQADHERLTDLLARAAHAFAHRPSVR